MRRDPGSTGHRRLRTATTPGRAPAPRRTTRGAGGACGRATRSLAVATGFTLIELLVVIVLAGILISLVSISVTPDPRQQLAREAERVGQLLATAADEVRIRQQPIVWEADLRGYRFYLEGPGERQLIVGDDLLRERSWERPLTRLAILEPGRADSTRVLLSVDAPPLRLPLAREWVQAPRRLELTNDSAQVALDLDEFGRARVALR